MSSTIAIGYDQVFQLVRQLSPRDRERLAKEMVSDGQEPIPSDMEPRQDLVVLERRDGFALLQVPFPDTEEGRIRQKELEQFQEKFRGNHPEFFEPPKEEDIEKRRQTALQLALTGPVATQEDIENHNEFRRIWRCRPM